MSTVKDLGAVSAYALAVKYGYVGTEEEWVNEQEAKRKQAVEAANSAAINANTVLRNVSVAREFATTASNARNEAVGAAEQAKTYAENAEAITGIEIAKKDRAGIVKGGENHIAEDGTLQLTVTTTERTIQDSYAGGVKINEIDGASEQESTTGKNLLNCSGLVKQTAGGITFTPVYKNGMLQYIEANGTCTATNLISFDLPSITLQADEKYVLSGCPSGGGVSKYYIQYNYFTADFGTGSKITGIESPTNVRIVVVNGTTVNNLKFYPMIRLASVEDATYEPYTGNAPSPSPDYPQEIESVVVGEIKTSGKNLTNVADWTNGGIKADGIEDSNSNYGKDTVYRKVKPNTYYVFSMSGDASIVRICQYDKNKTFISREEVGSSVRKIKVLTTEKTEFIRCTFYINSSGNVNSKYLNSIELQLEENEEATEYEPYQESIISLSNPITLHGIGDVKDRIVRKDGVFGIERKFVKERLISEGMNTGYSNQNTEVSIYARVNSTTEGLVPNGKLMCNSIKTFDGIAGTLWDNFLVTGIHITSTGTSYTFRITGFLEEATDTALKNWLDTNEVYVVAELAEPTFESLPTADQIALHNLKSFDTATYISTDSEIEPVVEVEVGTSKVGGYNLDAWNTAKRNEIALANLTSAVLALNQE